MTSHLGYSDLPREPGVAHAVGPDGLHDSRHLVARADDLAPGGWLRIEHGWDQGGAYRELLDEAGLAKVGTLANLARQPRLSLHQAMP